LASSDPLQERLGAFLDNVAAETSAPGAGAVAAVLVALGAALVEMATRFSEGAEAALAAAGELRSRVAPLAQADGEAYAAFLVARQAGTDDAEARARIVAVPLEVAGCAAEVAALAVRLAEHGNPNLRGEAVAAAQVASAGAAIASKLVELNLGLTPDARLDLARGHAAAAAAAAKRAASPD
jgi:formiminotetrahydrofolate cyclodeaminase